jgi:hypothetical protein
MAQLVMISQANVFALDKDDGALYAFPSVHEAVAYCKGVDVADGFWRFFADDGSPLEARWDGFAEPQGPLSGRWLQELLNQIRTVSGCGLATAADLDETLRINRGKRVERDSLRR